jgi:hypothetical protein
MRTVVKMWFARQLAARPEAPLDSSSLSLGASNFSGVNMKKSEMLYIYNTVVDAGFCLIVPGFYDISSFKQFAMFMRNKDEFYADIQGVTLEFYLETKSWTGQCIAMTKKGKRCQNLGIRAGHDLWIHSKADMMCKLHTNKV